MRWITILIVALLQAATATRPSIVAVRSDPPLRNFRVLYYDDEFLFAARDYGSMHDPRGYTDPGLFVHSKAAGRWMRVSAVSTAGGRFGKSWSDDPADRQKAAVSQVSWDFTRAAERPYIESPLHTSGSIAFPDLIELEKDADRYVLHHLTSFHAPSVEVTVYVARADLREAFTKR
jgi:hypothetical protein